MKNKMIPFAAALLFTSLSAMAAVQPQVSPFMDNIAVNLSGFPAQTLTLQYTDNNDVNITGPASVSSTATSFPITISSANEIENGFPSMTMTLPSTGTQCVFTFVDGPWTDLAYAAGNPPSCAHLTVSPIIFNGGYSYSVNVTYTP